MESSSAINQSPQCFNTKNNSSADIYHSLNENSSSLILAGNMAIPGASLQCNYQMIINR